MQQLPYISICIPAYKNPAYLDRLLSSVSRQRYRDFEVIVTDDSPGDDIRDAIQKYADQFPIRYHKNDTPLGSPANWNQAIRLAKGQWIKMMHDDDWFADSESLQEFFQAAQRTNADFIFSGFVNVDTDTLQKDTHLISVTDHFMLKQNPLYLFRKNYIGHPSTTLIKNNRKEWYDSRLKWVVDFEFYIRTLQTTPAFVAIPLPLIHIGISSDQITREVFRNPTVEIPENLYLLSKLGHRCLKNIFVYDHYWRLIRNLRIRAADDLHYYVSSDMIPASVAGMIQFQHRAGQERLLKSGFYSKIMMGCCYVMQRLKGLI
jgi:glycosyltransferase involved in cell wall biosynthesis